MIGALYAFISGVQLVIHIAQYMFIGTSGLVLVGAIAAGIVYVTEHGTAKTVRRGKNDF